MLNRYKLILTGRGLYKEVDIPSDEKEITIGTAQEAQVRLRKELFFSPISLVLRRDKDGWAIICSDNLYFSDGGSLKKMSRRLSHGDEFVLKYEGAGSDVFRLSFMIDFDYEKKNYDLEIDLNGRNLTIGGDRSCDIVYKDELIGNDTLSLKSKNGTYYVVDNNTRYGVFVNGARIERSHIVKDYDFFSIVGCSFFFKGGKLYTSSKQNLKLSGLTSRTIDTSCAHFEYPKFNRNTRIQYVIPQDEIQIQQAPPKPQKQKKNLIMSLIPSVVMLAMTVVLRGIIGGGGTFVIYSAVSMGLGIVMSVVSFIQEKKEYQKEYDERIAAYNKYIEEKKQLIQESRANELRIREETYQSLDDGINDAMNFGKRLFERSPDDADYLQVYLGTGRIESANPVQYTPQEFADLEDPLATIPAQVSEQYKYIDNAPIVSDFSGSCGVGIVGTQNDLQQIMKNMTLDLAIRHFYSELKMVYIFRDGQQNSMRWVRWLHNLDNERLDIRNIACDEESRNLILEDLYVILSARDNALKESKDVVFDSQYVVFVTDCAAINCHPVSKYLKNCATYGFTFVFLAEYEENLPQGCTEIIRLEKQGEGMILKSADGDVITNFRYPEISDDTAEKVAMKLGAVYVDEVSLEGELTKNITLFEMLGILSVEDIDLKTRWQNSKVYKSLSAPLGVKNKNQMVYLDIGDKAGAHGPHGLVAGTTGSGKSEILQTYILSMATLYHPYEVGFVIIDFKGGGMSDQFTDLPHLIGTITNIDGREINRSLQSIKSELSKRQELLRSAKVQHIKDYIKLYKEGAVTTAMPHLIMIVDEFAELKQEYPDFMKELISAARIGRTLGVHLILATQKPAGVVDAQIWSNSKFKLCLKVQTKEDSNEVIKTPLAAEIVEPGRAYFQVGNNEIFELFQSAYSGADVPEGNDTKDKIFAIYERNLWGKKELKFTNKKTKSEDEKKKSVSQLKAIVGYVKEYCDNHGIRRLPGICLPSLSDRILTREMDYSDEETLAIRVPIGMYDDPEQQEQGQVMLELSKDNVYIVGSAQTGKTVMLQSMIYGLMRKYTPKQVNMYLIDCGSMVLNMFEESAHVGGVVLSNEEEKCKNLFKLLNTIVVQRKKKLASKGVGNFASYLEAGYDDLPMIVVAIDNMAAFKEYFPDQAEEIGRLSREAQGVGISLVVTAAMSNALNYRTQANFGEKLVLNCNDPNEYSAVFGHCKNTPKENPGRGLLMMDKRILEYQVAVYGEDKDASTREADRSKALKAFIAKRNTEVTGKAVRIPMVPDKLSLTNTMAEDVSAFRNKGLIPVGMDFGTVALSCINFNLSGSLALLGDQESRDVFVLNFMRAIAKTAIFHQVEAFVVDDKAKKLRECMEFGFVRHYTADTAEGIALVSDICSGLRRRQSDEDRDDFQLLIINSADVYRRICADKTDSKDLAAAIKNAAEAGVFILVAPVENAPVGFNASEVVKALKESRQGILFAPLAENKFFELSGRTKGETSFDQSMGYRFDGNTYTKIKIFDREV